MSKIEHYVESSKTRGYRVAMDKANSTYSIIYGPDAWLRDRRNQTVTRVGRDYNDRIRHVEQLIKDGVWIKVRVCEAKKVAGR